MGKNAASADYADCQVTNFSHRKTKKTFSMGKTLFSVVILIYQIAKKIPQKHKKGFSYGKIFPSDG